MTAAGVLSQHNQDPFRQMRQVQMRQEPTAVARRPGLSYGLRGKHRDRLERARWRAPRRVVDGAQPSRGPAHVDDDALAAPAALLPDIVGRNADGGQHGDGGFADAERPVEEGIIARDATSPGPGGASLRIAISSLSTLAVSG